MVVPGKALTDGHTYVVALRNLKNSSGAVIPSSVLVRTAA